MLSRWFSDEVTKAQRATMAQSHTVRRGEAGILAFGPSLTPTAGPGGAFASPRLYV